MGEVDELAEVRRLLQEERAKREALERELRTVLDATPGAVRVREGTPVPIENLTASVALTLSVLLKRAERAPQ